MKETQKNIKLAIGVFCFCLAWELFFTWGLDFFWEDFPLYQLDKEEYPLFISWGERLSSIAQVLISFVKEFFAGHRFFYAGFGSNFHDRPYQFLFDQLLGLVFSDKAVLYRVFKSIFFSINATILFFFMRRVSLFSAFIGTLLYVSSSEVWVVVAYSSDVAIYTQFCILMSIVLFWYMLEQDKLNKSQLLFYYFFIFLFANSAVLLKGDGRYLSVLFFLYLMCFYRKAWRVHWLPLSGLLLLEVPLLGYIKKFFINSDFSPIDIGSHNTRSLLDSIKQIINNFEYPLRGLGLSLIIIFFLLLLINVLYLVTRKKLSVWINNNDFGKNKQIMMLVFVWFVFSFIMIALSRSFVYSGPADWAVMEISFFVGPFIVFLVYYFGFVVRFIKSKYRLWFYRICILLIIGQLLHNFYRINQFRGGWGNYFCAWRNVEKYIDNKADNALVLTSTSMNYKPFVFRDSNNKVINNYARFGHDLKKLEKIFEEDGYSNIFTVKRYGMKFSGESDKVILKETKVIDGSTGDLYDRVKTLLGKPSRAVICVYHFQYKYQGDLS